MGIIFPDSPLASSWFRDSKRDPTGTANREPCLIPCQPPARINRAAGLCGGAGTAPGARFRVQ